MLWILALPSWAKAAIIGGVLFAGFQVQHWWTVRGLREDIAELTQNLNLERAAMAELRVALIDVQSNRDKLEAVIRQQNDAIELLQARARQVEASANLRVARAVRAGEEAARQLRATTTRVPPGHEAMNLWLRERL